MNTEYKYSNIDLEHAILHIELRDELEDVANDCIKSLAGNDLRREVVSLRRINNGEFKGVQFRNCIISGGKFVDCEFVMCEITPPMNIGKFIRSEFGLSVLPDDFDWLEEGEGCNRFDPVAECCIYQGDFTLINNY